MSHIDTFIRAALPIGAIGQPYHRLNWQDVDKDPRPWWQPPWPLDRRAVDDHLDGRAVIAPRFGERSNFVEIDIDAKTPDAMRTLLERLYAVVRVLDARPVREPTGSWRSFLKWPDYLPAHRAIPGIVWRSSGGRCHGVRYRLVLDADYASRELEERVHDVLDRHGIPNVEIFPMGSKGTRAPLGKDCVLWDVDGRPLLYDAEPYGDVLPVGHQLGLKPGRPIYAEDEDGEPILDPVTRRPILVGRGPKRRSVVRSKELLVDVWAGLVEAKKLPLAAVFGSPRTVSIPAGTAIRKERRARGRSRAWQERIDRLLVEGAPDGGRFPAARDLTWYLVKNAGLAPADAYERYAHWLETAPHTSKDLTGPDAADTRARMLRSARKRIAKLWAEGDSNRRPLDSQAPLLALSSLRIAVPSRDWRKTAIDGLSADDRAWVDGEPDPSLRPLLGVLLAAIRATQAEHPDAISVAMPACMLQTIASVDKFHTDPTTGEVRPTYRVLRERAVELGMLGRVVGQPSKRNASATVFEMPPPIELEMLPVEEDATIARVAS